MALDYRDPNLVYFVGNSAFPSNTSIGQQYKVGALGVLVDIRTSMILDANITLVSQLSIDFVKAQMVGRYLARDIEDIIVDIDRYQGQAQKAIIVALRIVLDRYNKYIERLDTTDAASEIV